MIKKSISPKVGPTKSNEASTAPVEPQHREVINARFSTRLNPEALAECNREIRVLSLRKNLYSVQKVYRLIDKAFFGGRIAQVASIKQCRSEITAAAKIGSLLECDSQGGIIICLPPRGEKSTQDILTVLLREMACIHFWKVHTCSCQGCRDSKSALRVCDFIGYLSKLNAAVNFHLKGFESQWRIESGEFLVLKDIIKALQDAERVEQKCPFTFEMPRPTPEVTSIKEPLETQSTAPEVTWLVEKPLYTASEDTLLDEEPPEEWEECTEISDIPLDTASEDTLLDEEPLEKQEEFTAISEI